MSGKRVVVTGSAGKAGKATTDDLLAHGYDVLEVDIAAPLDPGDHALRRADLTDLGQVMEVLHGAHAVVHLAAIPAPMDRHSIRGLALLEHHVAV